MKDISSGIGPNLDVSRILDMILYTNGIINNTAREDNVVNKSTIHTMGAPIILRIGPSISMRARQHRERSVCPGNITTPCPFSSSVYLEGQFVAIFFARDPVIE